jgi:hypothetical protein
MAEPQRVAVAAQQARRYRIVDPRAALIVAAQLGERGQRLRQRVAVLQGGDEQRRLRFRAEAGDLGRERALKPVG